MKRSSELLAFVVMLAACSRPEHADQDPLRCAQCHTPEFRGVHDPPHVDARPTTCGVCHVQNGWHRVRIEHPWYELTGAHLRAAQKRELAGKENTVECFWCHKGDPATWKQTKKECVSCHLDDYESSDFPEHDTFPKTCDDCHGTDKWKGAKRPDAGAVRGPDHDAGTIAVDAAAPPTAHPIATARPTAHPPATPTPKPTATPKPTVTPPDVVTRPSRRR